VIRTNYKKFLRNPDARCDERKLLMTGQARRGPLAGEYRSRAPGLPPTATQACVARPDPGLPRRGQRLAAQPLAAAAARRVVKATAAASPVEGSSPGGADEVDIVRAAGGAHEPFVPVEDRGIGAVTGSLLCGVGFGLATAPDDEADLGGGRSQGHRGAG